MQHETVCQWGRVIFVHENDVRCTACEEGLCGLMYDVRCMMYEEICLWQISGKYECGSLLHPIIYQMLTNVQK